MGQQTGISWTDHTFNPWWGCVKVSPACDHCYAERDAKRYGHPVWGKDAPRRFFSDKHWLQPVQWNRSAANDGVRRRVFCASMADVFEEYGGEDVLGAQRARLWALIGATPHLDWQLLTAGLNNSTESCVTSINGEALRDFKDSFDVVVVCGVGDAQVDRIANTKITASEPFAIIPSGILIKVVFSGEAKDEIDRQYREAEIAVKSKLADLQTTCPPPVAIAIETWREVVLVPKNTQASEIRSLGDVNRLGGKVLSRELLNGTLRQIS